MYVCVVYVCFVFVRTYTPYTFLPIVLVKQLKIVAILKSFYPTHGWQVCLNHLVEMCGHEYDIIRWKGLKIFDKTAPHFTRKVLPILKSLLGSLTQPNEQVRVSFIKALYYLLIVGYIFFFGSKVVNIFCTIQIATNVVPLDFARRSKILSSYCKYKYNTSLSIIILE